MSTTVLVEQRPSLIHMLACRVPTYTCIIISLLAVVLVFQILPYRAIAKPPVPKVTRKRRSTSITSNTSTLVDPNAADAPKKDASKPEKEKHHHVSFPSKKSFNKLGLSVKVAISRGQSMKLKLPRRLSLPVRRLSSSIVTTLHNITPRHRRTQADVDSPNVKSKVEDIGKADVTTTAGSDAPIIHATKPLIVSVIQTTKVEVVNVEDNIKQGESHVTIESPQKATTFSKPVAGRPSMIFSNIVRR